MLALSGVALLMLVMFGLRGALAVLVSLGVGIFWLGGALGYWNMKINFMNFVALPITLGVGAEYAANIWARFRNNPGAKISDIVADTGSAVALCSLTTVIGYATLLKSRNHALRSFGIVADIGEVTTLLAALVALPLLIVVIRKLRRPPRAAEPS
jgi:predicted RND superfamily exporter protein